MKIIVDTREKRELEFCHPSITEVKRHCLSVGDYGCEFEDGYIVPIVFDRKSVPDLYGTFGKGYERFKQCIVRAKKENKTLFVIVEGTLSKVMKGCDYSQMTPISLLRRLFTVWIRHGCQTIFCKDRNEMSQYITEFYYACGKDYVRKKEK